jgi:hypothetical protein
MAELKVTVTFMEGVVITCEPDGGRQFAWPSAAEFRHQPVWAVKE